MATRIGIRAKEAISSAEWLAATSKAMGYRSQKLRALDLQIKANHVLATNTYSNCDAVRVALKAWCLGEPAEYKGRSGSGVVGELELFLGVQNAAQSDLDRQLYDLKLIEGRKKILLVVASLHATPKYAESTHSSVARALDLGLGIGKVQPAAPIAGGILAEKIGGKIAAKKLDAPAAQGSSQSAWEKVKQYLANLLDKIVEKWRSSTLGFVSKTFDKASEILKIVTLVMKCFGASVLPIIGPAVDLAVACKKSAGLMLDVATTSYHKSKLDIKHGTPAFLIQGMQNSMRLDMFTSLASAAKSAGYLGVQIASAGAAVIVTAATELSILAIGLLHDTCRATSINEASMYAKALGYLGPDFIGSKKFNKWFQQVMTSNPPIAATLLNSIFCPKAMFFFNMKMLDGGVFVDDSWDANESFLKSLRLAGATYLEGLGVSIVTDSKYVEEGLKASVYP